PSYERQLLHRRILDALFESTRPSANPEIIFTAGAPGSGKSTVLRILETRGELDLGSFVRVDADQFHRLLPEYETFRSRAPSEVDRLLHIEATFIRDLAVNEALARGFSIIREGTFTPAAAHIELVQRIRRENPGYKITIVQAVAPLGTILDRARQRSADGGRNVPESAIVRRVKESEDAVEAASNIVDRVIRFDNSELLPEMKPKGMLEVEKPLDPRRLNYKIDGPAGAPVIVLIHGLDSRRGTFLNIIPELSKKYRVLSYDQRGHGKSPPEGIHYTPETMALDLKGLLDHLEIEKAVLLGHSMGARTAVKFAELEPHRVEKLVIEDMELISRGGELTVGDYDRAIKEAARRVSIPREFPNKAAAIEAWKPIFQQRTREIISWRGVEEPDGTYKLTFRPDVNILYGMFSNAVDMTPGWSKLTMPTLVMRADPKLGSAISKEGLSSLINARRDIEVVTISGSNHTVHRSGEREFLSTLLGFLARHGGI
ncbi:MAG: alpha/beta fold hydrolase, partial [Bdellovibrionota bacterium]